MSSKNGQKMTPPKIAAGPSKNRPDPTPPVFGGGPGTTRIPKTGQKRPKIAVSGAFCPDFRDPLFGGVLTPLKKSTKKLIKKGVKKRSKIGPKNGPKKDPKI
jgi:hypothetical protein